jgi:hypothetical protein
LNEQAKTKENYAHNPKVDDISGSLHPSQQWIRPKVEESSAALQQIPLHFFRPHKRNQTDTLKEHGGAYRHDDLGMSHQILIIATSSARGTDQTFSNFLKRAPLVASDGA